MGRRYSNIVLNTAGLRDYWRLASGATPEASIGPLASNIAHVGSPTTDITLVTDPTDSGKKYNGTTQYSSSTNNASFNGQSVGSMEAWFIETALHDWAVIMGCEGWPSYRFLLQKRAAETNVILGYRNPVAGVDIGVIAPYKPLQLNHVGATYGPHGTELIVNGVLTANVSAAETFPSLASFFIAGTGSASFEGIIDEVATYNVRVPVSTFKAHYLAGLKDGLLAGRLLPV